MPLLPRLPQLWHQFRSQWLSAIAPVHCIGWAIAALTLWGFYEIVESQLVQRSQWIDLRVLLALRPWTYWGSEALWLRLAQAGEPPALGLACALAMTILVWWQQWIPASMVAISTMGALALNPLVQSLFPPAISPLWQQIAHPGGPTLLLHGATAFLVYGILGYLLAQQFKAGRWAIAVLTVLLIGSIGASRVALGLQGITNLITGYTVEGLWLMACLLILQVWHEPMTFSDPLGRSPRSTSGSQHSKPLNR